MKTCFAKVGVQELALTSANSLGMTGTLTVPQTSSSNISAWITNALCLNEHKIPTITLQNLVEIPHGRVEVIIKTIRGV